MKTAEAFGPGRLDESFLQRTDLDPWILSTQNPDDPGHRDDVLGNGWMGQRFGIEGDARSYLQNQAQGLTTASGCIIHGFWDDLGLMTPPLWAVLDYHDGSNTLQRGIGRWEQYHQQLDLRTATLTTQVDWHCGRANIS